MLRVLAPIVARQAPTMWAVKSGPLREQMCSATCLGRIETMSRGRVVL